MLCVCKAHGSRPITHRRRGSALFATSSARLSGAEKGGRGILPIHEMPLVVGSGHFHGRRPGTARAPSLYRLCRAAAVSGRLRFPAARGEADCRARTTAKPQTKTCLGRGDAQPERDSSARAWACPHPAKSAARAPQQHLARRLASGAATPSRSATSTLGVGSPPPTESVSFALPPTWRLRLACSARCRSQTSQSPCMRAIRRAQFAPASSKGRGKCEEQKLV